MSQDLMSSVDPHAAEQLYDELLSRVWALHALAPAFTSSPDSRRLQDALRGAAWTALERATIDHVARAALGRALWPVRLPPIQDSWWRTPLGRLILTCDLDELARRGS
jgi:hypothetical protein